jgi:hypothetical protein
MGVDSREGLAIADLIFYIPALFVAFYISFNHGFGKKKGWFFLIMLSLVRLVGAIAELVYVNSPSTGALTAYIVCSSVGLSPLILILLAILLRVYELPPQISNFRTNVIKDKKEWPTALLYNPDSSTYLLSYL